MNWYPPPLRPQSGLRYLVTGANAGLGFFTAARLAGAGAHVVMSGRSPERLDAAVSAIRTARPAASVETLVMDQSSLDAVEAGATRLMAGPPLDGVVANAGMVHTPAARLESADGNELVLATNVLGHFALLGRLLPHLSPGGRIVSLGSLSTWLSTFRVEDLQLEREYDAWRAYAQSKIASQAEYDAGDERHREGEAEDAQVGCRLDQQRAAFGRQEREQRPGEEDRQPDADDAAEERQDQALDQKLADQLAA